MHPLVRVKLRNHVYKFLKLYYNVPTTPSLAIKKNKQAPNTYAVPWHCPKSGIPFIVQV